MRKIFLLASFLLCGLFAQAGRVITDSIQSKVLNTTLPFNIYLPDGFSDTGDKYPVVYLLHGLSDNHLTWCEWGRMQLVIDELIGTGEAARMIIVMPKGGDHDVSNVPCGYFNMPGWNYEDFFFQEFIPTVEHRYNAVGDKAHRAVMGLSMGGGGSVVYCQRHPDMFSSCYAMSAWLDNKEDKVGPGNAQKKDWLYYTCQSVRQHSAIDFMEKADDATLDKLRTVNWFIDCGDDDFLFDLSVRLHQLMRQKGVHDELRVRNGTHNWEYWHNALRLALPFVSRNFGK